MAVRVVPFRERFWFLPTVLCTFAVILSQALILVDKHVSMGPDRLHGIVYQVGAEGARGLLSAVAGSVLTAAATTFSITIAVVALATTSYGPRLVRNFMADRGNQAVLGTFLATFLYALLVLRSVQNDGVLDGIPGFVPHLAVNVSVVLAVADIAVLVYFIHHISDSIQISTLSGRIRDELRQTIEGLYPQAGEDAAEAGEIPDHRSAERPEAVLGPDWRRDAVRVPARRDGYIAGVTTAEVVRLAVEHDAVVVLEGTPGDHLIRGDVVGWVRSCSAEPVDEGLIDAVHSAVAIGTSRTPHQDVRFAVQQLVEIAVRALSPGTNDPYTAVNAVDDLTAGLALLAERRVPSAVRLGEDGQVRLIADTIRVEDILIEVFRSMRVYALGAPSVLHRVLALGRAVGAHSGSTSVLRLLDEEIVSLVDAYRSTDPPDRDLRTMVDHARQVRDGLGVSAVRQ